MTGESNMTRDWKLLEKELWDQVVHDFFEIEKRQRAKAEQAWQKIKEHESAGGTVRIKLTSLKKDSACD